MGPADSALSLRWPWVLFPAVGAIRVSTVLTALAILAIVWWRRRSPLIAIVAVMAWASAFEIAFNAVGAAVHGWSGGYLVWLAAALAGWVVLAAVLHVVPDWRLSLAAALVALVWVVTGFAVNAPGPGSVSGFTTSFSIAAEAFNEVTKMVLGAAYLVGALRATVR